MKNAIQNFGAMEGNNRYGVPFDKLDVKRQIVILLELFGDDHQFRKKAVSESTKRARKYVVYQFIEDLQSKGYESPRELRRLQLLREWSHEKVNEVFPRSP